MANTAAAAAATNRMNRNRFWENRGFDEGLEGFPPYPNVPGAKREVYDRNYAQGKRYADKFPRRRLMATPRPTEISSPDVVTMPQPFDGFSWVSTTGSSMFTRIAYNAVTETLRVVFRNSGKMWEYSEFSGIRWYNFYRAPSFGSHAKKFIFLKGYGYEVRG